MTRDELMAEIENAIESWDITPEVADLLDSCLLALSNSRARRVKASQKHLSGNALRVYQLIEQVPGIHLSGIAERLKIDLGNVSKVIQRLSQASCIWDEQVPSPLGGPPRRVFYVVEEASDADN